MKKIIYTLSIFSLTIVNSFSQAAENRDLKGFNSISASSSIEVILKQDSIYSVQVEAPRNRLQDIKTELRGNTLELSVKGNWHNEEEAIVIILAPNFEKITTSGVSIVKSKGLINSENLKLVTSGASEVYLSLKTSNLKLNTSGASNLILTGYSENIDISASGASNIEATQLDVANASISLSGASNTKITVNDYIDGTISGVANLDLRGEPKTQSINKSGSASINGNKLTNDENVEIINDIVGDVIVKENGDTTKITIGKKKLLIIDDWDNTKVDLDLKDSTDEPWYYGIDGMTLGVNGFLNSNNELKVPATHDFLELDMARSINFQITALDGNIDLYKKYITFHPGLGLEFNSYEFRKNYWINPSSDKNNEITAYEAIKDTIGNNINFSKNRLKDTYLNAPIMFAFHTNKDHKKAFHLGLGGYAGVRLASKMKYKYKLDGEGNKDKVKDDFYLSPFRYGLMASVGYSKINIFANYALNGLFEDGKGPELHPFSVGLMIVGF